MKVGEEVENDNLKKRGRPKGSKNGFTKAEVEKMQRKIDDLEKQYNSYDEVVSIAGYKVNSSRVIVTVNTKRHCNKCGFGRQYYLYEIDKNSVSSSARVVSEFNVLSNDGC